MTTSCGRMLFNSLDKSSTETAPKTTSDSGNGGTYDGKLRVLHHYVNDFTCEGKSQPESILIRENATDWFLIKNTKETCSVIDRIAVSPVDYDDVLKLALFQGKVFTPPKPYVVDPNEDPNLPDVKLIDGVCEDINGKCSLRAAIENAGLASWTSDIEVQITAAIYKINKAIYLTAGRNSHNVLLQGRGAQSTVLDGQGITDLLKIDSRSGAINIDGVTFKNAVVTVDTTAAPGVALSMNAFNTKLVVSNSIFKDNVGSNTFYAIGTNDIEIKKSQFINNASTYGMLFSFTSNSLLVDQSTFDGNGPTSIHVLGGAITNVSITNSFIGNGSGTGIILDSCSGCQVINTTLANNRGIGVKVFSFQPTVNPDVLFNNVTLANNGSAANDSNLEVVFQNNPTYKVILNNSILTNQSKGFSNCFSTPTANSSSLIVATNSLFDDATCAVQGTGNITGNPQLSAAANNGGLTPTLLPAATSPVLNAGDINTCSAKDQRGYPRPSRCDLGAVEIP